MSLFRSLGNAAQEGRGRFQIPVGEDEGSLTLAPGWPPASPQPATENPYGNTRERLTNGTALAVKCQDSRSSKIGIRRQVRRNPQTGNVALRAGLRPGARAPEPPPNPKAGAPALDSTEIQWTQSSTPNNTLGKTQSTKTKVIPPFSSAYCLWGRYAVTAAACSSEC